MSLKMKSVKEVKAPLLSGPESAAEIQISEHDRKIIQPWLHDRLKFPSYNDLPFLFRCKKFGLDVELSPKVQKAAGKAMSKARGEGFAESPDGEDIAMAIYYRRELGIPEEITEVDDTSMLDYLDRRRHPDEGHRLIWMYYFMNKIGRPQPVTDEDKEIFRGELQKRRDKNHGSALLEQHAMLKEIGVKSMVEEGDREMGEKAIKEARDNEWAEPLAESLYFKHVLGWDQETKEKELPPIRNFKVGK